MSHRGNSCLEPRVHCTVRRHFLPSALVVLCLTIESAVGVGIAATASEDSCRSSGVNVRDFGAKGNGVAKDHGAIQHAIDHCAERGGGTVWVPAGRYLCGTIVLKSNIRLHLDAGAVILGSPDREDYRRVMEGDNFFNNIPSQPVNLDQNLIVAWKAANVSIEGRGVIDSQGVNFYDGSQPQDHRDQMRWRVKSWRPGATVAFMYSKRFTLSGITIRNSPFLNVVLFGSRWGQIHDVKIIGDHRFRTCDGIHTKACCDLMISDCEIDSEDDALSFYTNSWGLPTDVPDTSNVAVTNCLLTSSCCGIRIGFAGRGELSNLVFSNIVVRKANRGIDFICNAYTPYQAHVEPPGPSIHNVLFSNVVVRDSHWGISANLYSNAERPACIRDIRFNGMHVRSRAGNYLVGSKTIPVENISFRDVDFIVTGELEKAPGAIPDPLAIWSMASIPHALYLRHADNVALRDCRIRWDGARGHWTSSLHVEDGKHIDCRTLRVDRFDDKRDAGITSVDSSVAMPEQSP